MGQAILVYYIVGWVCFLAWFHLKGEAEILGI